MREQYHKTLKSATGIAGLWYDNLLRMNRNHCKFAVTTPLEGRKVMTSRKILVMDDEEIIREVSQQLLVFHGYSPFFAEDGAQAVILYEEAIKQGEPFDAVILDLTVPGGMGGLEALKKIQEIDPGVKAIVSSGLTNDPIINVYHEYGFSGVILKPYRVKDIGEVLNHVISGLSQ